MGGLSLPPPCWAEDPRCLRGATGGGTSPDIPCCFYGTEYRTSAIQYEGSMSKKWAVINRQYFFLGEKEE